MSRFTQILIVFVSAVAMILVLLGMRGDSDLKPGDPITARSRDGLPWFVVKTESELISVAKAIRDEDAAVIERLTSDGRMVVLNDMATGTFERRVSDRISQVRIMVPRDDGTYSPFVGYVGTSHVAIERVKL